MINFDSIKKARIESNPYEWGFIDDLFSSSDKEKLSAQYPMDHFKSVIGYDGDKTYEYECRNLIGMGKVSASFEQNLGDSWLNLSRDLLAPDYRNALSILYKRDLSTVPMEVNVFHYRHGASIVPHVNTPDYILSHILFFNEDWDDSHGGCLSILNSNNRDDVFTRVLPIAGHSVLIIRSNQSWYGIEPIKAGAKQSYRLVTITFYHPCTISTLWPPNEEAKLPTASPVKSDKGFIRRIIEKFF